MVTFIDEEAES